MEANYRVYYYANNDLVRSHFLRNDHICFILDKVFHTSPRVMGCQFGFSGKDCNRFCEYMLKFVCKKSTYLDDDFVKFFLRQRNASIDVIRNADLDASIEVVQNADSDTTTC